jgi:hypothetical protein
MGSQQSAQTTDRSIVRRRNKLKATVNQQIKNIDRLRGGKRITGEQLVIDRTGAIHFRLRCGPNALQLESGCRKLKADTLDDLVEQLEQMKIIVDMGGLDQALAAVAEAAPSDR